MTPQPAASPSPRDTPPVYDGRSNMEHAPPGTCAWAKEAGARLRRLHEDFETLRAWAAEQEDNFFAEQVALDAEARLAEWDEPVERWEPVNDQPQEARSAAYRHGECPNCGRVRVQDDGVCEKCLWDSDGGDYATITRPHHYAEFGHIHHAEMNDPFGRQPECVCGESWPCRWRDA